MTRRSKQTIGVLLLAGVATLAAFGVASGFWSGSGSGSAIAQVGSPQDIGIGAPAPVDQLYPGGSADVAVSVANPNPYPVRVGSLSLDSSTGSGGFEVDAAHGGCSLGGLHFAAQTNGGNGWQIPAKVGATEGTLAVVMPDALSMGPSADGACQGAAFTIHLRAGV
jgi:hypothetical protein